MQLSFGLVKNFGNGKLLGCGDSVNTESKSLIPIGITPLSTINEDDGDDADDDKTLETSFGRSLGSGPNGAVDAMMKDLADTGAASVGFESLLGMGSLDFLGVRE